MSKKENMKKWQQIRENNLKRHNTTSDVIKNAESLRFEYEEVHGINTPVSFRVDEFREWLEIPKLPEKDMKDIDWCSGFNVSRDAACVFAKNNFHMAAMIYNVLNEKQEGPKCYLQTIPIDKNIFFFAEHLLMPTYWLNGYIFSPDLSKEKIEKLSSIFRVTFEEMDYRVKNFILNKYNR